MKGWKHRGFKSKLHKDLSSEFQNQFFLRDDGPNNGVNVDLTYRCPLECIRCSRQQDFKRNNLPIWGHDLPIETIDKLTDTYRCINFCGQLSDPVHHPKFIEILELCFKKFCNVTVHNASSAKSEAWYTKAFKAHPQAYWWFGIDGLPEESHKYRVNQDGVKLFNIMVNSKKVLLRRPTWQYIIFKYNEHHKEQARQMAIDNDIQFLFVHSAKWLGENDPLMPTKDRIVSKQHFTGGFGKAI